MVTNFEVAFRQVSIDVLVVGGGMAGIFAALAARESGLSVAMVEPSNVLGGQGTVGGVAGFCGDSENVNRPFADLIQELARYNLIADYKPTADRRRYDLEGCGFLIQEAVTRAGIEVYLHSRVIDARAEAGRVSAVLTATAGGMLAFAPRFVIDPSGGCVIATAAGLPVEHDGSLKQLPMSLYFTLWDTGKPVDPFLPPGCPKWEGDDDLPMTSLHQFPSGKVEVKMKVIGFDSADGKSLSDAEIHARRQMMGLVYHLQTKGYRGQTLDRHVLASVSRQIGVRETNRIIGEHVLTEDEVTHSAVFDDAVAVGTYHLDYHWPDKVERAGTGITTMVEPYHIPLRSLIPKGAKNILVPGRSASGDQMAMSSFRVMATCAQMGYAAGKAAAQSLAENCDIAEVSIPPLQKAIEAGGQSLNLSDYGDYLRHKIHRHEHIFDDNHPFMKCHASTLVQLPNNRYLAAWFAGTAEGKADVAIWTAIRSEGRWSPPRQLSRVRQQPHWNPVLFIEPAGAVHLFFKVGQNVRQWETWHCVSRDHGQTWSKPAELVPGDCGGRGPVKNKPIILADGSWLAPASLQDRQQWWAFVDRSTDGGQTWNASPPIALPADQRQGPGVIQPTLWESKPGAVHMLLRSTETRIYRSDSADGGLTWCSPYPTDLPNNNSGIDLARLVDGTLALVYNPVESRTTDHALRTPLSVALSFDNGQTWPNRLDLETDPGEYAYPAIIATAGGMAITYTWRRERIAFWLGSIERIPAVAVDEPTTASTRI